MTTVPRSAEIHTLGNGVHRVTLPLPFLSPKAVNCYLFEGTEGLTLLDCGVDGLQEFQLLSTALDQLGFEMADLHRLIASHLHVDHMGMAKRIVEATGSEWVLHASAVTEIPHYNDWTSRNRTLAGAVEFSGAPADVIARVGRELDRPEWFSEALEPTHPVEDGNRILLGGGRTLEVIYTPGHQANHLCLLDSRTGHLFSGDHVLPRISPFIPFTGEQDDHLGTYLASLERIVALDSRETHPGHGPLIPRGSARAHQILLHHRRRLDTILEVLDERPRTPWEVVRAVFRPNLTRLGEPLAFQETMAHLEYLRRQDLVTRISTDGVWQYRSRLAENRDREFRLRTPTP